MELSLEFINADMQGVQYPYNKVIVFTTGIANHNVHCVLVDSGSLVNIISQAAYDQMSLPVDRLR